MFLLFYYIISVISTFGILSYIIYKEGMQLVKIYIKKNKI
jgi:hypothetical protein